MLSLSPQIYDLWRKGSLALRCLVIIGLQFCWMSVRISEYNKRDPHQAIEFGNRKKALQDISGTQDSPIHQEVQRVVL